jgi:acyl carrier protein
MSIAVRQSTEQTADTLGAVKTIICEVWNFSPREAVLEPRDIAADEALFDVDKTGIATLGLDSLDALEISM